MTNNTLNTAAQLWTVNAIKESVSASGSHWFDRSTMRFFGTRVSPTVYQGPGGIFFITSEKPPHGKRAYTVRQFMAPDHIGTIGEVCQWSARGAAIEAKACANRTLAEQWQSALYELDRITTGRTRREGEYATLQDGLNSEPLQFSNGFACSVIPYETRGYYLKPLVANQLQREAFNGHAYDWQRELCRVLTTAASMPAETHATETTEPFQETTALGEFLRDCQRHGNPEATDRTASKMILAAADHQQMMCDYCNGPTDYFDQNGDPRGRLKACRHKIRQLGRLLGAKAMHFSGDPRGVTVKIVWPGGATNDWASEGWIVPERLTDRDD